MDCLPTWYIASSKCMSATNAILKGCTSPLTVKYPGEELASDGASRLVYIREFVRGIPNAAPVTWEIGTYPADVAATVRVWIIEIRDEMFPGAVIKGSRALDEADVMHFRVTIARRLQGLSAYQTGELVFGSRE